MRTAIDTCTYYTYSMARCNVCVCVWRASYLSVCVYMCVHVLCAVADLGGIQGCKGTPLFARTLKIDLVNLKIFSCQDTLS